MFTPEATFFSLKWILDLLNFMRLKDFLDTLQRRPNQYFYAKDNILIFYILLHTLLIAGNVDLQRLMPVSLSKMNPGINSCEQLETDWQLLNILIHKHKQQSA